ncbi:DUF998 domain-containing protein [Marinilactibacillus kalidii]|uniref:DUF998 domain-containing protein n=1 Tax=Marinilactibacillus kalidii TaxID=2820274 RepID=UPI001ABECE0D|nr:DUF998 domain-containing protein [Marinilactibacillus kalidii]
MEKHQSRRLLAAALFFIAASTIYLSTEAISAHAWVDPDYGYTYHYISDLGVAKRLMIDGRAVYSPLAYVMNSGFILYGLLSMSAYLLAAPLLQQKARVLVSLVAVIQGVGNVLVGLFPGETYDYTNMHTIGAGMAIAAGNLTLILFGIYLNKHHSSTKKRLRKLAIGLGIFGLIALGMLLMNDFGYPAVFERLSVYTMTLWNYVFGIWLIRAMQRKYL